MQNTPETISAMAAKAAPPVSVIGAHFVGITVPDVIQVGTMVYVLLMVVHKIWHMWREMRTGKRPPGPEDEML